jgi:hypothetical protein
MDCATNVYLSEAQKPIPSPPLQTVYVYTVYFMHRRRILCTLQLSLDFLVSFVLGGSGPSRANKFESFLGPVKWHRADRRVPFGAQKTREFQGPTPSHLP